MPTLHLLPLLFVVHQSYGGNAVEIFAYIFMIVFRLIGDGVWALSDGWKCQQHLQAGCQEENKPQ